MMLKKTIAIALLTAFCSCAAAADNLEAPPKITSVPTAKVPAQKAPAPSQAQPRSRSQARATYEASRLEPTAEDMARAREQRRRAQTQASQRKPYVSDYGTVIEERYDQNNRLTEIRVTPGSTSIPYTMKNTSDRPIDNRPGADPRSTLDTPKFIEFGW